MNVITALTRRIRRVWRPRRMQQFLERVAPGPRDVILDIGGYADCWEDTRLAVRRIDILNVDPIPAPARAAPEIRTIVGDGCALKFGDGEYEIVFSNSVIEHVGTWEQQQQFAAEVRRVGRKLWVQTPAYACPIEPHCLAPFIHWLPWSIRKHVMWLTPVALFSEVSREGFEFVMSRTRILRRREFQQLFPDCEILTERMLGLIPKSYVAWRVDDPKPRAGG